MISKNRISEIRKLHAKKYRDQERLFLVEGRKSVEMLLQSDFSVVEIFATENCYQQNQHLLQYATVTMVTVQDMERISALSTTPELLAVVRQPEQLPPMQDDELVIALDRIADPGNLGTIIRTADWFGIQQIVCSPDCVDLFNPKTIQSTMGSFAHVSVRYTQLVPFLLAQIPQRRVLGTFLGGESVNSFEFRSNDILVIGSESHGISPEVASCISQRITIPRGKTSGRSAESLNAAIAAAIVMSRASY